MATVRELVTKIGFNVNEAPLRRVDALVGKLKTGLIALVSIAAARQLFHFFEGFGAYADEIDKLSQRTGIGVESLQRLAYAAKISDIDMGQLSQSLAIFSKRLSGADEEGKGAGETFKKLGIDPKKFKDTQELILAISDKISGLDDANKKTALSMELFGKSGAAMVPFLNQGSNAIRAAFEEADAFNAVLGKDAVEAGVHFDDTLKKISAFLRGTGLLLASKFIPYINKAVDWMVKWIKENRGLINSGLDIFARVITRTFQLLADVLGLIVDYLDLILKPLDILIKKFTNSEKSIKGVKVALLALAVVLAIIGIKLILIGALIAGIILIYDDVKTYLEGGESLFGPVYDKIKQSIDWIKAAMRDLKSYWDFIVGSITKQAKLTYGILRLSNPITAGYDAYTGSGLFSKPSIQGILGSGPVSNNQRNDVKVTQDLTINMDGSADPQKLGETIKSKTKEVFDDISKQLSFGLASTYSN